MLERRLGRDGIGLDIAARFGAVSFEHGDQLCQAERFRLQIVDRQLNVWFHGRREG
jgi:hypothetical protein